jgi:hypothetical protein
MSVNSSLYKIRNKKPDKLIHTQSSVKPLYTYLNRTDECVYACVYMFRHLDKLLASCMTLHSLISLVSIVTVCSVSGRVRDHSLHHLSKAGSGAHPTSFWFGIGGCGMKPNSYLSLLLRLSVPVHLSAVVRS